LAQVINIIISNATVKAEFVRMKNAVMLKRCFIHIFSFSFSSYIFFDRLFFQSLSGFPVGKKMAVFIF